MICPRCLGNDVTPIGTTHYVCNNPNCKQEDGSHVQFRMVQDDKVHFPYNQIFVNRGVHEFYRLPYLTLPSVGVKTV